MPVPAQLTPSEAIEQAMAHAQAGRADEALILAEQAKPFIHNDVAALHRLGVIHRILKFDDKALEFFKKALSVCPNFSYSQVEVASILHMRGDLGGAIAWYVRATEAYPDWWVPAEKAGLLLTFLGRHDEAVGYLERACTLQPGDKQLQDRKAACLAARSASRRAADLKGQLHDISTRCLSPAPAGWRRVRIVRIENFPNAGAAFDDIVDALAYGLSALGCEVDIAFNEPLGGEAVNILIGAQMIQFCPGFPALPDHCVVLNAEPMGNPTAQTIAFRELLRKFPVWDYSKKNISHLAGSGIINSVYFELGYVQEMTRILNSDTPDIDVLFYGSLNERRSHIIHALRDAGVKVQYSFGVFGEDRDLLIGRSKIILNLHFYDDGIFEIVRCSYLMANHKLVVCEVNEDTEIPEGLRSGLACCRYSELVDTCIRLLDAPDLRRSIAERGFQKFSARSQAKHLEVAISQTHWS